MAERVGPEGLVYAADIAVTQALLASIRQSLRPGGEVVVIDFERIPGVSSPWILAHVRAGKQTVIREIKAVGFTLVDGSPYCATTTYLRFRRP